MAGDRSIVGRQSPSGPAVHLARLNSISPQRESFFFQRLNGQFALHLSHWAWLDQADIYEKTLAMGGGLQL